MSVWETRVPKPKHSRAGRAAPFLVAWVALWAAAPAGASSLYTFVDEKGVTHFSNRPNDPRYQLVPPPANALHTRQLPQRWEYDGMIRLSAAEQELPPALVKAVIAAESSFDSAAISHKGAQGLMQLMPETAELLGVQNPLEPSQNIRGGSRYLRAMMDRYGDMARALAAYNAGPTAVDRYGGVPPYPETRDYVTRVLNYSRLYHGDFRR
jgi:soluble lytic murein transglycosylase